MPINQIPDDWHLSTDSQDIDLTLDSLPAEVRRIVEDEQIDGLFIALDSSGADYAAVYGFCGSVPYTWKTAVRLYPIAVETIED